MPCSRSFSVPAPSGAGVFFRPVRRRGCFGPLSTNWSTSFSPKAPSHGSISRVPVPCFAPRIDRCAGIRRPSGRPCCSPLQRLPDGRFRRTGISGMPDFASGKQKRPPLLPALRARKSDGDRGWRRTLSVGRRLRHGVKNTSWNTAADGVTFIWRSSAATMHRAMPYSPAERSSRL